MNVGATQLVTVGVSDLDDALALFRDAMSLTIEREGVLDPRHLALWQLTDARARYAELSANGYPFGRLRLVQFTPSSARYVRQRDVDGPCDVGPKAIDFYVADPIAQAVAHIESAGYLFRSPPQRHLLGEVDSEECVFYGPDDVPVLLMVGHNHGPQSLRPGSPEGMFSEIATVSIVVEDLMASRDFYQNALGLTATTDAETPDEYRELVCRLTGAPPGSRVHFLLMTQAGEPSGKILLLHYFDATGKRLSGGMRPGNLGFSLLTHGCEDIDALARRLGTSVVAGPATIEYGQRQCRALMATGPNGETFEFVDSST